MLVSLLYLWVGTSHQQLKKASMSELPIFYECTVLWMSHLLHIARDPAISDQFVVQILYSEALTRLHRDQAGDKLHQRPLGPNSCQRWFPMCHCTALQRDQKKANCWNLLDEQLVWCEQK